MGLFLLFIDVTASVILSYLLYQQNGFSVIVLFAFEFTILACSVFTQICKFIILLVDRAYDGRWSHKPTAMFILDFLHDLTHLGLYSVFIWILTMNWGFPLHLLRELFMAFHTLQNRIIHFYNYSKIIKVLDTQFPTITRQQLIDSERDVVCVICFSEMESGKELPCKHVFHLNCLKRWFEQKQECPMCRLKITPNQNGQAPTQQAMPQQQNDEQKTNQEEEEESDDDDDNTHNMPMHHQFMGYHPMQSGVETNSLPYHQSYSYQNPYYPPPSPIDQDPRADLEELTRITQWKIEYYEMRTKQLKQELEQFISIQSKWKNEQKMTSSATTTRSSSISSTIAIETKEEKNEN